MGLINHDAMTLRSGLELSGCYLTFVAASDAIMPSAISMISSTDAQGKRQYNANATLYIYADESKKAAGNDPLETRQISIPVDPSGVFSILYDSLKQSYPNSAKKDDANAGGVYAPESAGESSGNADTSTAPQSSH